MPDDLNEEHRRQGFEAARRVYESKSPGYIIAVEYLGDKGFQTHLVTNPLDAPIPHWQVMLIGGLTALAHLAGVVHKDWTKIETSDKGPGAP